MKIKMQAWEPDTCASPNDRCRILILWDVEVPDAQREHRIAGYERLCAAHADPDIPLDKLLWWDGNWKPLSEYIEYQRNWFRRLNHTEWLEKHPNEQMPETIRGYSNDPVTTGSAGTPNAASVVAHARGWDRNKENNARKNQALTIPGAARAGIDTTRITFSYSGVGDARVLTINCGGQLTNQQRTQAQNIATTQFGAGKVVIEP